MFEPQIPSSVATRFTFNSSSVGPPLVDSLPRPFTLFTPILSPAQLKITDMDHITVKVPNSTIDATVEAYLASLAPLNIKEMMRFGGGDTGRPLMVGMGDKDPFFWLAGSEDQLTEKVHLAFKAKNRKQVDEFHAAATKAGFKCNGEPGLRTQYHPNYYGAFVHDTAGNNIEAVVHDPEE